MSLQYCSNIVRRRSTKLCTMFGRLLHCYTVWIFGGFGPLTEFGQLQNLICIQVLHSPTVYCQRYCTVLEQRPSAKLRGMVLGMELWNFRRGRHLYSAGWPSRWASAHIRFSNTLCICHVGVVGNTAVGTPAFSS